MGVIDFERRRSARLRSIGRAVIAPLVALAVVLGVMSAAVAADGTIEVTTVTAGTAMPLAGVDVWAEGVDDEYVDGVSDAAGEVSFADVPPGAYRVGAYYYDDETGDDLVAQGTLAVTSGGTATITLGMATRSPGLYAYLADESGAAVQGATVELVDEEDASVATVSTNADGLAAFPGVPEGDYAVVGTKGALTAVEWASVSGTEAEVTWLTLAEPGIAVEVLDEADGPVSGADVLLLDELGEEVDSAVTSTEGRVKFTGLIEGPYTVETTSGGLSASEDLYYDGGLYSTELRLNAPGLAVHVDDDLFGSAIEGADVTLSEGGVEVDTLATDARGRVKFTDLETGDYSLTVAKAGYDSPTATPVTYEAGTYQEEYLSLSVDYSCEPTTLNQGLTNMGFESQLTGWTKALETETVTVTGADAYTAPWEGTSMLRLGTSRSSNDDTQAPGPNVVCQDFVVDQAQEHFAFNVFTYDYTGFDEFHFDVVVSGENGETLAAYTQGAWGEGTSLKTSGWRGISLDLADRMGETVTFTVRSGGTSDELYPFWTYLDSADVTQPPSPQGAVEGAVSETGSVTTDPTTGQITVSFPSSEPSDLTLTFEAECADDALTPTSVSLNYAGTSYDVTPTANGSYRAVVPGADIADSGNGPLSIIVTCDEEPQQVLQIGQIVLYDPSGYVTNAVTDAPVVGAEVRLHKVPGWVPATPETAGESGTCQTNATKPAAGWNQSAPTQLGVLVSAASPEISPNVNPFLTNPDGYYGWDVAEGCWYVTVTKTGFHTLVSPVVGVPTEVTDLDLELTPVIPPGPSAACLAAKNQHAAAQAALGSANASVASATATSTKLKAKLKKAKKSGKTAKIKKAKAKYKKASAALAAANATAGARGAALTAASAKVAGSC